jgi:hypothetical protein
MKRFLFPILACVIFGNSCLIKSDSTRPQLSFKSFEISFTDGWKKEFSFFVDTNKIYFSPVRSNKTYYGILPDSIFKILDSCFLRIHNDTAIKSTHEVGEDVSILSLKIVTNSDTIFINQTNDINKVFFPVIKAIQKFIDSDKRSIIHSDIFLETQAFVRPMPILKEVKFKKPALKE